jgi:hypothetical protein
MIIRFPECLNDYIFATSNKNVKSSESNEAGLLRKSASSGESGTFF